MKQKITISISVLLLLISLHKITTSGAIGRADINTQSVSDSFKIGATDNAWQGNNDTLVSRLKHNVWHKYGGYPNGWKYQGAPGDSLYADSINYYQQVKSIIDNNASNSIMTAMDRGKISLLAWSQRSDYQCEDTLSDNDYWFYGYNTHSNINMQDVTDSIDGKAERVRYCYPHPSGPEAAQGWIVKDLTANREQINRDWWYELNDSVSAWFIKPRIRIDSDYANDPGNFNKEVCKIFVLNFNGDTIKQSILRVRNFLDQFGNYNGIYLEEFRFEGTDTNLIIQNGALFNPDKKSLGDMSCQVDFRIWYYGNCEMWIDRVRVENEVADELLSGVYDNTWLRWECNLAMENPDNIWNFYIEEFEFNNTPSIAYVNKKIKEYTNDRFSLMVNLNYELYKVHLPYPWTHYFSAEKLNKYLFEPTELETWWNVGYVLEGWTRADSVSIGGIPNYHPNTLSNSDYNASAGILSYKTTPAAYDDWLQVHFDQGPASVLYINQMKLADTLSKDYDKKVINLLQAHMWHQASHKLKEPSNEELEMINMLPLTYGIKGIIYFTYSSVGNIGDNFFYRGLIEPGLNPVTPRYYNVYGQEKWTKIKYIATKLNKWGPYLVSFDNDNRKSYIYRITSERNEMSENTFIDKLKSFPALEFAPDPVPDLSNEIPESSAESYLQAAFFQKENPGTDKSKYFMIVNRRCSPFINYNSANNIGGRRLVTMKINPTYMPSFNNWKIINLENEQTVTIINKNDTNYTFIGDFMPGEGKLYKLAPVMQEGGTLVTDEVIPSGGITFNCNGDVNNNGYDINIYGGTTIYFANEVRWNINGGEFISGLYPETPDNLKVYMYAQSGAYWGGINFIYCTEVNIDKTVFANVKANPSEEYNPAALLFVDCHNLDISYNEFNFSNLDSLSCISINYLESPEETPITAGVKYNVFNTGSNKFPSLICNGFAEATVPLMVNGNVFNSSSGNIAVFLSNVSAGVIKNNTISNYKTGVNILSSASYADFYNNNITGDSIGVQIIDGTINLGMQGSSYTGGYNRISSLNSNANNINSIAGYFTVPDGLNTFNINNSSAYHFGGTFSMSNSMEEYAGNNCFKLSNSQTTPLENVNCTGGLNCSVDFIFDPVNCAVIQTNEYLVFDIGGGNYDTIYIEGGGMGGSISNVQSSMFNEETNVEITSVRDLYNSICLEMRKRNYELVHTKCMGLLNNYIDSVKSMDGLSKLYHSSFMLDSLGNRMSPLKTYFETLILNNGENEVLIKKLFYLIQKCKVSLGQYESAMSGFEQIMNQNPFSYEGLVASWDYAATSLLDSLHGSGGGMKNLGFGMSDLEFEKNKDKSKLMKSQIQNPNSQILKDDPKDKYDAKTFTKEDRKTIRENIFKSFETSREKEIKEIKSLESKIREGKASESEKSEYNAKIVLNEIIKVKNPKDITEHIKIVNEDIQKIFESGKGKSQVEVNNIIPTEYSLSQNYPNPFNPVTRIKFSLPEESSVKLTVYDILGREVKKLVNEKLSIGSYEYEFNARLSRQKAR